MRARPPEEAVRLVDEIAAAGYDGVKIYNHVSKAEYPALIAVAKRRHLLLMGHIPREPDLEMTLAAGQSVAHADEFVYTAFTPGTTVASTTCSSTRPGSRPSRSRPRRRDCPRSSPSTTSCGRRRTWMPS
jgi:hypothetical protein